MLYAGEPIGEPLIQHGPFVADSAAAINDLFRRYRAGEFAKMSQMRPTEPAHAAQPTRPALAAAHGTR